MEPCFSYYSASFFYDSVTCPPTRLCVLLFFCQNVFYCFSLSSSFSFLFFPPFLFLTPCSFPSPSPPLSSPPPLTLPSSPCLFLSFFCLSPSLSFSNFHLFSFPLSFLISPSFLPLLRTLFILLPFLSLSPYFF